MNPWDRLKNLLHKSPKLIGVIATHNLGGTSSVTLTGGGTIRVSYQQHAIGDCVFIRDQQIIDKAPRPTFN